MWAGAGEAARLRLDLLLDLLANNKRCVSACGAARGRDGFEWHAGRAIGRIVSLRAANARVSVELATGALRVRAGVRRTRDPR